MKRLIPFLFAAFLLAPLASHASAPLHLSDLHLAAPVQLMYAGSAGDAIEASPAAFMAAGTLFVVVRALGTSLIGLLGLYGSWGPGAVVANVALGVVIDVLALKLLSHAFSVNASWEATAKGVLLVGVGGAVLGALVAYLLADTLELSGGASEYALLSAIVTGSIASPLGVYLFSRVEHDAGGGGDVGRIAARPDVRRVDEPRMAGLSLVSARF